MSSILTGSTIPAPVRIILVPYHAGVRGDRVGAGPMRLIADGLEENIRERGFGTEVETIAPVDEFEGEIGRSFELIRRVATAVSAAVTDGSFPLVLAGNCNTTVGVHAGLPDKSTGVVWFDAHPDFDTPDEHRSGYFDGMGAATLTGRCWKALAATVPGHRPIPFDHLIYCGIRDFEPGQEECLADHEIAAAIGSKAGPTDYVTRLCESLDRAPFERALIHIDLDCLDTSVGLANEYAAAGGLSVDQLLDCIAAIRARLQPVAVTVASFSPGLRGADRISKAGRAAIVAALPGYDQP